MTTVQILKLKSQLFYVQKRQSVADYLIKHSLGVAYASIILTLVVIPLVLSLFFAFIVYNCGISIISSTPGDYFDCFVAFILAFIFIEYGIMQRIDFHMKPSEINARFSVYTGLDIKLKIHDLNVLLERTILNSNVMLNNSNPLSSLTHGKHKYKNKI